MNSPDREKLTETAQKWAARGVPVFPIAISQKKQGQGTNKRPLTPNGHRDASTVHADVAALFRAHTPVKSTAVMGVAGVPGAAGFVVFDLDRHGGPDGIAYGDEELKLPTATYRHTTGSNGEHRWLTKRDPDIQIGNVSLWEKAGVDVRSDKGWVVVAADTPWGNWSMHSKSTPWEEGCASVPELVWATLTSSGGQGRLALPRGTVATWSRFDPSLHLPQLHPEIPGMLERLRHEGAEVLAFKVRDGGEPYLELTCDGITTSATLGYIGPCGLYVFSSGWPGRSSGPQDVDLHSSALGAQRGRTVDPGRWFDSNGLLAADIADDLISDAPIMRDPGDGLWVYTGGVWRPDRTGWVRAGVTRRLGNRSRPMHTKSVSHVLLGSTPTLTSTPVPEYLNLANGLLDWQNRDLLAHDPAVLSTIQLPVRWIPNARCPIIEDWLADVLPKDLLKPTQDGPGFIWEVFGYLCFSGNPLHKAVLLLGAGRNGKGTLLRLVTALLGAENVSNVDLHSLVTNRFRVAELYGKVANIAGDLDGAWLESTALFKAITGGDFVQGERKYGAPFDFHPFAVPVYSANKVFGTPDTTDGYLSRWLVIPFPHSFYGREDRTLDERLQHPDELEGLLQKAVEGLLAVMRRGNFTTPGSVSVANAQFADESDPIRVFINEVSKPATAGRITRETIWLVYQAWCQESGQRKPLNRSTLYTRLAAAGWVERKRHGIRGFDGRVLTVEITGGVFGHSALAELHD